jgi:predicted NUDIX family NTP pyrophosphohydrolase
MAKKNSAGILLYRIRSGALEVFLVHPGGPFWAKKDAGAWSIPKGEFEEGADPQETGEREFFEETGSPIDGRFVALTPQKQRSGKLVHAKAVEGGYRCFFRQEQFILNGMAASIRQAAGIS